MSTHEWTNNKSLEQTEDLKNEFISANPFEHISISNLFKEEKLNELLEELEKLDYYLEDHDLYQFLRTVDFKQIENTKIQEFRSFIFSEQFVSFIESIVNTKLSREKGDLHSLKLLNTHYLLCHDDRVQKRKIAFILNLSKDWKEKDGGKLELFDSKGDLPHSVVESITPSFNQFNMFLVGEKSFHQISEVESERERISISGWFYEK